MNEPKYKVGDIVYYYDDFFYKIVKYKITAVILQPFLKYNDYWYHCHIFEDIDNEFNMQECNLHSLEEILQSYKNKYDDFMAQYIFYKQAEMNNEN